MGAVEAKLFAREGAKVVLGDVLEAEGMGVEAEINESGGESVFIRLDVTVAADWEAAVGVAVERFGRLDILVNNAGISNRATLEDTSDEAWDRMLDINAKGVFLGFKTSHTGYAKRRRRINHKHFVHLRTHRKPHFQRRITPRRAPCGCSQRPRPSSTPRRTSAATRCIRVSSKRL